MERERDDIIKALECCASPQNLCEECPIDQKKKDDCICGQFLAKNALALITSQEQRIKELTEENERFSQSLANVSQSLANSEAENERLKLEYAGFEAGAKDVVSFLKADTVRKMQELIYERLDISVEGYSSEEIKSDVRDMVYQIAKEILEGEK